MDIDLLHREYVDGLRAEGRSERTIASAVRAYAALRRILPDLSLRDFGDTSLLRRIARALDGYGDGARLEYLRRIAAFGNWLSRRRYTDCRHRVPRSIARGASRLRWRELPTDDEIERLLNALRARAESATPGRRRTRERDYLVARLLVETGARISEILALRAEDVVRHAFGVHVVIRGTKSESAERVVPISSELGEELRAYRVRYHIARGPLWRSRSRKLLSSGEWGRWLVAFCRDLGISVPVTPHTFRYRYIVSEIARGASALEVMSRVGHADIAMTARYFDQVRRMMPHVIGSNLDVAAISTFKRRKYEK